MDYLQWGRSNWPWRSLSPERFDEAKIATALALLGQRVDDELKCVYCEAPAATWDHLYNNVVAGRFSGRGNRIFNLVPACRSCNEKKGAKLWRRFLAEIADPDPGTRAIVLENFEKSAEKERFGWDDIRARLPELAASYEAVIDEVRTSIDRADEIAAEIRSKIRRTVE